MFGVPAIMSSFGGQKRRFEDKFGFSLDPQTILIQDALNCLGGQTKQVPHFSPPVRVKASKFRAAYLGLS